MLAGLPFGLIPHSRHRFWLFHLHTQLKCPRSAHSCQGLCRYIRPISVVVAKLRVSACSCKHRPQIGLLSKNALMHSKASMCPRHSTITAPRGYGTEIARQPTLPSCKDYAGSRQVPEGLPKKGIIPRTCIHSSRLVGQSPETLTKPLIL